METTATYTASRFKMRRFFWLPLGLTASLVILVLAGLVLMSWRSVERLQPLQKHIDYIANIQALNMNLDQTMLRALRGENINQADFNKLIAELNKLSAIEVTTLYADNHNRLRSIADQVKQSHIASVSTLAQIQSELRAILSSEQQKYASQLTQVSESTQMELRLSIILLVVLPFAGAIGAQFLQRRVEQPLRDLQMLLDRLSGRDFQPLQDSQLSLTAKQALPAFQSYNLLVSRLRALEAEHQDREQLLVERVRKATEALLAQSRELSRAERLAAVGAISAGFAHELRNPLAGIQLACSKLKKRLSDEADVQRVTAVIQELQRINHLLTEQVDAARHAPEVLTPTDIAELVNELLSLMGYQIPDGISLHAQITPGTRCLLPAASLRQALLNLILNAVQIQGESGHVMITAEFDGEKLILSVSDEGPGFPEQMLRAGIRPFATGRRGGTGLGLAMVRRFVRDLDGDLILQNLEPRGARVSIELPCPKADDQEY